MPQKELQKSRLHHDWQSQTPEEFDSGNADYILPKKPIF